MQKNMLSNAETHASVPAGFVKDEHGLDPPLAAILRIIMIIAPQQREGHQIEPIRHLCNPTADSSTTLRRLYMCCSKWKSAALAPH